MLIENDNPSVRGVREYAMGFKNAAFVRAGDDIAAKYNWLKSSDRDAVMGALSLYNRRVLVLAPGRHTPTAEHTFDTSYVDIAGMIGSQPESIVVLREGAGTGDVVFEQTAWDIRLTNFTIDGGDGVGLKINAKNEGTDAVSENAMVNYKITKAGIAVGVITSVDRVWVEGSGIDSGWRTIINKVGDNEIRVPLAGMAAAEDVSFCVIPMQSIYKNMFFRGCGVAANQSAILGYTHIGGMWKDCHGHNACYYWLASGKYNIAAMIDCSISPPGSTMIGGNDEADKSVGIYEGCYEVPKGASIKFINSGDVFAFFSGLTYSNSGAGSAITFSLPSAVEGLKYTFVRTEAGAGKDVFVDPQAADAIVQLDGTDLGNGKYYGNTADAYGEITIECRVANKWQVVRELGTWAGEG